MMCNWYLSICCNISKVIYQNQSELEHGRLRNTNICKFLIWNFGRGNFVRTFNESRLSFWSKLWQWKWFWGEMRLHANLITTYYKLILGIRKIHVAHIFVDRSSKQNIEHQWNQLCCQFCQTRITNKPTP